MKPILAAALFCIVVCALPVAAQEADDAGRMELGKNVFLEISQPRCSVCHTLDDVGTTARVGPPLDQIRPTYDRVYRAVKNGIGPMPPNEVLSEEELDAVAHYVSTVTDGVPQ